MKRKTVYIIRDHRSLIHGYVETFEEADLICQKKNAELNINNESSGKKWSFQILYPITKKSKCI